jgi:hypothetical protein
MANHFDVPKQKELKPIPPRIRVPHLRDGFIVAKVGNRAEARSAFPSESPTIFMQKSSAKSHVKPPNEPKIAKPQ